MLNAHRDRDSRPDSTRKTAKFLRRLREAGHPVVLTINGEAELVVQDPDSYEKLLEIAERADAMEALGEAVEEMRAGQGRPIEEMFAEMERMLAEKEGR
jgi:PHD/YefM family antitoxin component YafN of YafNO toxin-antitoxin module